MGSVGFVWACKNYDGDVQVWGRSGLFGPARTMMGRTGVGSVGFVWACKNYDGDVQVWGRACMGLFAVDTGRGGGGVLSSSAAFTFFPPHLHTGQCVDARADPLPPPVWCRATSWPRATAPWGS